MKPRMTKSVKARQQGVIFLLLMLVLFVAGSSVVIGALNNRQSAQLARAKEVRHQLEQAKAALLAYAANYASFHDNARGPGFLPCPADNATGQPLDTCDANPDAPKLGRLPEYEVLPTGSRFYFNDYYAQTDEQFWYVVHPRFTYQTDSASNRESRNRTSIHVSEDYPTAYALDHAIFLDGLGGYAALIIAPGGALATQNRTAAPDAAQNYLDGENGVANSFTYFTSYPANPTQFNDQVIGITIDEVITYMGMVAAREMRRVLDSDFDHKGGGNHASHPDAYMPTSTADFIALFDDELAWLRNSTSSPANGERWSLYTSYRRVSPTKVCLELSGYDLVYVFTYGGETTTEHVPCADVLP